MRSQRKAKRTENAEMSSTGNTAANRSSWGRDAAAKKADAQSRAIGLDTGWTVFGYLIAGMLAYGGIGWLIGKAAHIALLFPMGMLLGLGISIGFIIYRYGRPGSAADSPRKELTGDR